MTWIAPWRDTQPQEVCTACGTRCVASTLTDGPEPRCVLCVEQNRLPDPRRAGRRDVPSGQLAIC